MNSREIKRLCRQLRNQADALESSQSDSDQRASALAVGLALIEAASNANVEEMSSADFDAVCAQFMGLGTSVEGFFDAAMRRTTAESDTESMKEMLEQLEQKKRELEDWQQQMVRAEQERAELDTELEGLRSDYETCSQEHQRLLEERDAILRLMIGCGQEVIDAQTAENEALTREFTKASAELQNLKDEHEKAESELTRVKEEIASLPDENKKLLDSYKEKQAELQELQNAQETCSPEKQAELTEEIERLLPVVEEERTKTQLLEERLKDLEGQHLEYDQELQTLSTNILEKLNKGIEGLDRALVDHENALGKIESQAKQLESRMAECCEVRRRCEDWLSADTNPLESMITALKRPEAQELRNTLDPGTLREVREQRAKAESALRRLDEILGLCVQATHMDRAALEKRARR